MRPESIRGLPTTGRQRHRGASSSTGARYLLMGVTALLMAGFGPFVCRNSDVDDAANQLRNHEAQAALETLKSVEADAPEVHLARALTELAAKQNDAAGTSLDQAFRRVAEESIVDATGEGPGGDSKEETHSGARLTDLRKRVAFARGLVAIEQQNWPAAHRAFAKVLSLDPQDEDARWNLELAWSRAHPPCRMREDDHEPDDNRADAKPYDPEKAKQRLLCPANEDWYLVEVPAGALFYVSLEGEVDEKRKGRAKKGADEDEPGREVTLSLFGPEDIAPSQSADMVDGKALVGIDGVTAAGEWRIQVMGLGEAEVTYALAVEMVPPCPSDDPLEDNDMPTAASPVADGDQTGLKACPDDPDWFRVTVPAEQGRNVEVRFHPERGPLQGALFDAEAVGLLAQAQPSDSGLGFKIDAGDTERVLLVRIATVGPRENTYTLTVKPSDDEEGEDENKEENKDQNNEEQNQDQPEPPPPEQVDVEQLIEALDKHDKNPQLEKLLEQLPTHERLED